jgi:hypothetical protein
MPSKHILYGLHLHFFNLITRKVIIRLSHFSNESIFNMELDIRTSSKKGYKDLFVGHHSRMTEYCTLDRERLRNKEIITLSVSQ